MRDELSTKGETSTYRRLTMLRGAVEDSISGAVENRSSQEAQAVATGQMSPEDTMAAKLQANFNDWKGARSEAASQTRPSASPASRRRRR
jgi:hypothetical protein